MKQTAEVVIVGAGIMGCAIAHALAERGVTDVVVLERDQIGAAPRPTRQVACASSLDRDEFRLAQESVRV